MSVDIVGSTAYKNEKPGPDNVHPWLPFIHGFYREFPTVLASEIDKLKVNAPNRFPLEYPAIWKCLGDELVLIVELKHWCQPKLYVKAFISAVKKYDHDSIVVPRLPLGLKGACWTAGFPVINAEVPMFKNGASGDSEIDYIGPSIDIGFRLAKLADQRRVIISVELTRMLSADNEIPIEIYYDGNAKLHGVLQNRPYPVFWINKNNQCDYEIQLLGKENCPLDRILAFCNDYISKIGYPLILPFIEGDERFNLKPKPYDSWLKSAQKAYDDRFLENNEEPSADKDNIIPGDDIIDELKNKAMSIG